VDFFVVFRFVSFIFKRAKSLIRACVLVGWLRVQRTNNFHQAVPEVVEKIFEPGLKREDWSVPTLAGIQLPPHTRVASFGFSRFWQAPEPATVENGRHRSFTSRGDCHAHVVESTSTRLAAG
jgi:hypothetical protein